MTGKRQRCRKIRYHSSLDARIALSLHSDERANGQSRDKTPRREYRCPRCKGWHLTSMPKAEAS